MKTILGTGQLGIAVMEALLESNPSEMITMVNSKGNSKTIIPGNVRVMAADVTDKDAMEQIARRSEVIFSCTDVPYQHWKTFYPATAKALAYALSNTEAKLVFADNMYSYGNMLGATMTENTTHTAHTKKGVIRTEVINTLLRSGEDFNRRVAFVKAADFIGPRIYKGVLGRDFIKNLYEGRRVMLAGSLQLEHTFTHIHDLAKAMVNVGDAQDGFGQVWHAPNAPAMSLDKWIHLFEVNTGRKAKIMMLPKWFVAVVGVFDPFIKELYELSYQFEYSYLVDHSKYAARFGDHSTSPSVIVKQTVQWFKSENNIL